MDPISLGGLLTAAGKAGLFTAGSGIITSLINRNANKRLAENAYRQNLQMWREQNAYNNPLSQVARLRAAGLNPAIAYGGNGQVVGNSDSAPVLDYNGVYSQPVVSPDAVMQGFQAAGDVTQMALSRSQKELNDARTITELRSGVIKGIDAKYAEQTAKEMLRNVMARTDNVVMDTERLNKTIDQIIATRNLTGEQIRQLEYLNEFSDRTMEARVYSANLQPNLTKAQIHELNARVGKYAAEIRLIGENMRQLMTINGFLPLTLSTNLAKGLVEISLMQKNESKIDEQIRAISAEAGIAEKDLKTYFWRLFLGQYHQFKGESLEQDRNDNSSNLGTAALLGSSAQLLKLLMVP